jgi:hypothetical protein
MSRVAQDPKAFGRSGAGTALVAVVAMLAFAGWNDGAAAQTAPPPPPDDSAIDEYVEEIPTGSGGVAPGADEKETTPLPGSVSAQLDGQAGGDAAVLKELATSSHAGAPQTELAPIARRPEAARDRTSGLAAAASAVGGSSGTRLIGLLLVVVLITGAAAVAVVYRHLDRPAGT